MTRSEREVLRARVDDLDVVELRILLYAIIDGVSLVDALELRAGVCWCRRLKGGLRLLYDVAVCKAHV